MPIYEYQCNACGHQLEALQKFSDAPLTLCPECQQPTLTKLISAAGFQLKGTGWYATDYKGKAKSTTSEQKETSNSDNTNTKNSTDSNSNDSAAG